MAAVVTVLAVLTGLLTAAVAVLAVHSWRPDTARSRVRQRAVVNLRSGAAFSGVVWDHDRSGIVLRSAQALDPADGRRIAVDGEVWIPADQVEYLQYPG